MTEIPRLMIAAPGSETGKTTVMLALLSALMKRGASPVAFKCGPDYVDPLFHRETLGIPGYNLDLFFTGRETMLGLFCEHAQGHGIALVEGVMGYYDGVDRTVQASSHHLARITQTPVILVISAKGAALSLAALIKGFAEFKKPAQIAGVILNNCSETFYHRMKETLERESGQPLVGYFPRLPEYSIESRHLGLVPAAEIAGLRQKLARLGRQAELSIDIEALLKTARTAPPLIGELPVIEPVTRKRPRLAVARDAAFCFYYAENLALLERLGAEIVPFSPLHDTSLPGDTRALYLGGGYPELYAQPLGENLFMRGKIRDAVKGGMPILAECGGFLYLHDTLEDENGIAHPMVGVLRGKGYKTSSRQQQFGYITLTALKESLLLSGGETIPAHEFHYWGSTLRGDGCIAKKLDGRSWSCIVANESMFAGFPQLYFYSNPALAARFVRAAAAYVG